MPWMREYPKLRRGLFREAMLRKELLPIVWSSPEFTAEPALRDLLVAVMVKYGLAVPLVYVRQREVDAWFVPSIIDVSSDESCPVSDSDEATRLRKDGLAFFVYFSTDKCPQTLDTSKRKRDLYGFMPTSVFPTLLGRCYRQAQMMSHSDDPISLDIGRRTAILPFMGSDMLMEEWCDKSCVRITVDSNRCSPVNVVLAVEAVVDAMCQQSYLGLHHDIYLPYLQGGLADSIDQQTPASLVSVHHIHRSFADDLLVFDLSDLPSGWAASCLLEWSPQRYSQYDVDCVIRSYPASNAALSAARVSMRQSVLSHPIRRSERSLPRSLTAVEDGQTDSTDWLDACKRATTLVVLVGPDCCEAEMARLASELAAARVLLLEKYLGMVVVIPVGLSRDSMLQQAASVQLTLTGLDELIDSLHLMDGQAKPPSVAEVKRLDLAQLIASAVNTKAKAADIPASPAELAEHLDDNSRHPIICGRYIALT